MSKKQNSILNNLQKLGNQLLYSIISDKTGQELMVYDAATRNSKGSYQFPKNQMLSGFKTLRKNAFLKHNLVIIFGISYVLILDETLENEIWKLDKKSSKYSKLVEQSFVFSSVGLLESGLVFGTLTSELFVLKLFDSKQPANSSKPGQLAEDPKFRMIHKFNCPSVSVTDIVSVHELIAPVEAPVATDEILVSFSNSKIAKIRIPADSAKHRLICSFKFNDNFCSSLMLRLATLCGQVVVLSANINGTLSLLTYAELLPLMNFTLFSKSITCLSVDPDGCDRWEIRIGSNDGNGKVSFLRGGCGLIGSVVDFFGRKNCSFRNQAIEKSF